ncbi:MAG: ankyrin repeat domain-containing protein [Acidobacteria bacterium]|nr:ankyrin repeat domain-containing protein [Acidobacteriota bacterium]
MKREAVFGAGARWVVSVALWSLISSGTTSTQPADDSTALHRAAHRGDAAAVERLLAAGEGVDTTTRHGVTPLALASAHGHAEVVQSLLERGADARRPSPHGETPLMAAARTGTVESVELLLLHGAGAEVDAREGWRGQTALMWAAAEGHAAVVAALAAAGADVDARSDAGFTPLAFAVRAGHADAVAALLDASADIGLALPDGTSPLHLAVLNARYDVAVRLLERGADPTADGPGWTALHQLVWTRRPNRHYNNPAAFPTGTVTDLALARALVAHGADVDARQSGEPRDGYRNMLNRRAATPFLLAAKAVDLEMMRLLLDLGADPHLANEDGTTPLLAAAGVGIWSSSESPGSAAEALEAVELLRGLGNAVTAVDDNGDAALHGAVMRGSKELVLYLLEHGAALDPVNERGWTPLTIAQGVFYANLGRRWPEMEALLLELGATSPTAPEPPR